jgi:ketosteroid isomerase-like protein
MTETEDDRTRTPLDVVTDAYAALGAKDLDGVVALCAPGVVVTQDDALPWGGEHVGADGLASFAIALVGAIDSQVTPLAIFQAGDRVIQYGRTAGTVRRSGRHFDVAECHVWTVADGRITKAEFYIDTPAMLDALGRFSRE